MQEAPKTFNIEITAGTIAKAIFLIFMAFLLFQLKGLVLVVLTAVVIASAVEPAAKWIIRHGIPRVFSVLIIYALLGVMFVSAFYYFVPPLLRDTSAFLSSVPDYINSVSLWNPFGEEEVERASAVAVSVSNDIEASRAAVQTDSGRISVSSLVSGIDEAISSVSAGFVHSASSAFGGILSFILIIVLSFYLAVQEDGIEKFLRIVAPRKHEVYVIGLWKRTQTKIGLWMQGQIVLALVVGVLVYLGLTVLGIKNALLFAVLAAILEMIPLFGPIIAAIPAVAAGYVDGGTSAALIVAGLYLIIQQFENHLIYPLVVKKIVGVPPILVILSLLIGFELAGLLGMILSVPLSSMLVEFLDDIHKSRTSTA
ncbi:MAG: AI-2E family transporter [bacterium]|nr:AI-2E family transporter [bacterium]